MPIARRQPGAPASALPSERGTWWVDFIVFVSLAAIVAGVVALARRWSAPLRPTVDIDLSLWSLPKYTLLSLARGIAAYLLLRSGPVLPMPMNQLPGDTVHISREIGSKAAFDARAEFSDVVNRAAFEDRLTPGESRLRRERNIVAVANLKRPGLLAERDEFIASRKNRHARTAAYFHSYVPYFGRHCKFRVTQPRPAGNQNFAHARFRAGQNKMLARTRSLLEYDEIALAARVFVHHHGVCTSRHRSAG